MTNIGKRWRDAATLILASKRNNELITGVKNSDSINYDILLQTRSQSVSFANSVVFPGGVTEPIDGSSRWQTLLAKFGYTKQDFEVFHHPDSVITPLFQENPIQRHIELRITAIRETFEELGLLLCSRKHKEERIRGCVDIVEDIDTSYWQERISKHPEDWLVFCEEHNCYPDLWALYYWSSWLTPIKFQKRYIAAFFVAALEKKPISNKNESEVADVEWLSPDIIISSDKILYPPQLYELNRLSHFKDISKLIKFAIQRSGYDTDLSFPVVVKAKDGTLHLLPGDDLYPANVDYDIECIYHKDKTILELREGCLTLNRLELFGDVKQFIIQNYKPKHHLNMHNEVVSASALA